MISIGLQWSAVSGSQEVSVRKENITSGFQREICQDVFEDQDSQPSEHSKIARLQYRVYPGGPFQQDRGNK